MPVHVITCPKCGQTETTEYASEEWTCVRCGERFVCKDETPLPAIILEPREPAYSPPAASPPHYRAVSLWAVLSIASAVATLGMFFTLWFFVFPLAALYCGSKALAQIERLPEEYTGRLAAKAGMWTAAALCVVFVGWYFFGRSEVPPGYQQIDYALLEPDPNLKSRVPNAAQELADNKTKVYIKGYMLPPPRGGARGLTKFAICRNSDMCKFSMNYAQPQDQIHVECVGDVTTDYTSYQIGVGGMFCIDPDQPQQPYYVIKADYIY